jgi:hypothetical protein
MPGLVRAFLSYAHEDAPWRDAVLNHLGWLRHPGRLVTFDDRELKPGRRWDPAIKAELDAADIVILLISPHFTGSRYCTVEELTRTLARERVEVVPIVCDHVDLGAPPINELQCLPQDASNDLLPLSEWHNPNKPLAAIATSIRGIVERLEAERAQTAGTPTAQPRQEAVPGTWRQPAPPVRCFGRGQETRDLVSLLLAGSRDAVIVLGGPGMGKTTLTLEAACQPELVGPYGERRCLVLLEKAETADALVAAILEALGLRQDGPDPWPPIETALRANQALLVLDNLETPWQAQPQPTERCLARLAGIHGVRLLASIRSGDAPLQVRWKTIELHHLLPPHDGELLRDIAHDIPPDDPLLPPVLAALDGVPLAIELFAAEAAGTGGLGPARTRWQAERAAMLQRDGCDPADRLASLATSISLSLRSPRMNEAARRLYAMLGRLPDGLLLEDAAKLIPQAGADAARRLLKARLARHVGGRLRMLAPIREHAASILLAREDAAALQDHFETLANLLPAGTEHVDPSLLARVRLELANIEALLMSPADGRTVDGWLWVRVTSARSTMGSLALAGRAAAAARDAFASRASERRDNSSAERDLYVGWFWLGNVRQAQGDLAGALAAYEAARAIRERLAASDSGNAEWQRDLIVSHWRIAALLGELPARRGEASAHWGEALAVARALAGSGRLAPVDAYFVETLEKRLAAAGGTGGR